VALSLIAAGVVWRMPHPAGATVLAGATFLALAVELARRRLHGFARWFQRAVGPMLRGPEAHRLPGATTLAIGYTIAATAFPGWPAIAGILVAGVAGPAAARGGRPGGPRAGPASLYEHQDNTDGAFQDDGPRGRAGHAGRGKTASAHRP
jgi:hypothetical protein